MKVENAQELCTVTKKIVMSPKISQYENQALKIEMEMTSKQTKSY